MYLGLYIHIYKQYIIIIYELQRNYILINKRYYIFINYHICIYTYITTAKNIGHELERKWGGTGEELQRGKGMMYSYFNFKKSKTKEVSKKCDHHEKGNWRGTLTARSHYTLPQK